jgi:5'-nucleotidase
MKILHIDMDGVVADFEKLLTEKFPEVGNMPPSQERSDMVDIVVKEYPAMFEELEPITNAITAVKILNEHFNIYFLSTPMWTVPESYTGKRRWIEKHFGEEIAKKKLILTHRKDLVMGHYLIDDRLKNGAAEFMGEHIHFATDKFPNWDSVLMYLLGKELYDVEIYGSSKEQNNS